jgi:molecular chaperone DnaJ
MPDHYEVLGVSRNATPNEIKTAFRRLALKIHPDVNPSGDAEQKLLEILEAYEVLGDPEKRRAFDMSLPGASPSRGGFGIDDFTRLEDLDDLFAGEFLERTFGARGRAGPVKGKDLRFDIELSLEEAFRGARREVTAPRTVHCLDCGGSGAAQGGRSRPCPVCNGLGQVKNVSARGTSKFVMIESCGRCLGTGKIIEGECPACAGRGKRREMKPVGVVIPSGVEDGAVLRVPDEGSEGLRGGPKGDLYLLVRIAPHPVFRREGADIQCDVPVSFALAALGGRLRVPSLDGTAELDVSPGTQTGTTFRLAGLGMPGHVSSGRGDMLVTVLLTTPKNLTERQKRLLEGLESPSEQATRRPWWSK